MHHGGFTPSPGLCWVTRVPRDPAGQGQHPPRPGGLSVLWGDGGPAGAAVWPGIGVGVKPPLCPSLAPSVGQLGWLGSTLVFIYLLAKFLRQGPGMRRPSRNIPETPLSTPVPQQDHRHPAALLADPVCHCPRAPRSLQVAVPRVQGHCAMARLSSPCPMGVGCGTLIVLEALLSFFHAWEVLGLALFLLSQRGWCCCSVPVWRGPGKGLYPVGSAMGQCVSAEFPGEGMREICWPGRNAAVTKQLGWACQWRWHQSCATWGHPCHCKLSLSAVLCQAGQGCLMWPGPCARLGPPAAPGNVFLLRAHPCPFGRAGSCPAASWGPGVPCLCHTMPPACLAPCHQLLPAAPARGSPNPRPLVRCPTPSVSRETWTSRGSFAMKTTLPWATGVLSIPRSILGGSCAHGKARGGARSVRVAPAGTTAGSRGVRGVHPLS